jgi:phosphotransferase system enzyme I (PtsI)
MRMAVLYKGIPVSKGIALGKILKLETPQFILRQEKIKKADIEGEVEKLKEVTMKVKKQIQMLIDSHENSDIFTAHMLILEDPMIQSLVLKKIRSDRDNIEWALTESFQEISTQFLALEDKLLRERMIDLKDVYERMMRTLKNIGEIDLSQLAEEVVIVAKDLSPSLVASLDKEKVLAFVTELGGETSHTTIMARAMELPAVVGCSDLFEEVVSGQHIVVDGMKGEVLVEPSSKEKRDYEERKRQIEKEREAFDSLRRLPVITTDGKKIRLGINAGSIAEAVIAKERGADGIGLFRTEFIYMESAGFPTEKAQFKIYQEAAQLMEGQLVIIRTLDIGGDKSLPYLNLEQEMNPFLGYRAIRVSLDNIEIFKTQMKSILRASAFGKLGIMFPMIISIEELKSCRELLEECKDEFREKGIPFDEEIQAGMMIETPAAVLELKTFAKYADFFSIGTNDLTQYTLAVDRGNHRIHKLYNSFHPAVLRSIYQAIEASHEAGKWIGMCGELAGNLKAVPLLLGMGLDEFSVNTSNLLEVKEILINSNYQECKELAENILKLESTEEIELYLKGFSNRL